jgi:hypothetical protein
MIVRLTLAGLMLAALSGCPQASSPSPSPTPPVAPATRVATPPSTPSASPVAQAGNDFLIVPEQRFGPITVNSSEATLKEQFGAGQVRREKMYVGDGQEWNGIAVYPDQPDRRVEIFWFEENPRRVQMIQIHGESSLWKTAQGVSLGTTLVELEKLNGKPFELLGLGWDFGGGVTDWKGGALQGLTMRVDSTTVELTEAESSEVLGDQTVNSDNPAMRKANPSVSKITVNFSMPEPDAPASP